MTMSVIHYSHKVKMLQGICVAVLVMGLASCSSTKTDRMSTASIPQSGQSYEQMNMSQLLSVEQAMGRTYESRPKDKAIGMQYANLLMMTGKNTQSLAVMQQVAIAHPTDRDVLAGLGKSQAAAGQLEPALKTIERAQRQDLPDWRLLSAKGAVLDQLGRSAEARDNYRQALGLKPNDPSILSNMGMSYLLQSDPRTAEIHLRNATAQPGADSRMRQNLALVVGLQGRFSEAEKIAAQELSPQQADSNLKYLREMLAQQNSWQKLSDKDKNKS